MCKFLKKYKYTIFSLIFLSSAPIYSSSEKHSVDADDILGVAQPSPKPAVTTCVYQTTEDEYNKMPDEYTHSISFSGAGFSFPWYLGVATYLQEKYNDKLPKVCFLGASAGAMVSTLLVCNVKIAKDVMGINVKNDGDGVYTPQLLQNGGFNYSGNGWLDKVYGNPLITESTTGVYGHIFDAMRSTDNDTRLLPNGCENMATNRATFSLTNITSW